MKRVKVCENHLADFYRAVQEGNLPLMEKEEHELTLDEKCVACAYVFKSQGTVRDALEAFLSGEGLEVGLNHSHHTVEGEFFYWGVRLFVLLVVSFFCCFYSRFFQTVCASSFFFVWSF